MQQSNRPDSAEAIGLEQFLPYQISVLAHGIARRTSAIAKKQAGLNLSGWRVLAAVAEQPGRTAAEVVAVTPMDKGIVSRAVKQLLSQQLVSRRASADDGRVAHLYLTARGNRNYQLMAGQIRTIERQLLAPLAPADRNRISHLVKQMLTGLTLSPDPAAIPGSPPGPAPRA